jgi:hypothetical protein
MKYSLLILLCFGFGHLKAQNKKEQLLILANHIDSLNNLVSTKNNDIVEKQNQIAKLQLELGKSKSQLNENETQINNLQEDLVETKQEISNKTTQNQVLTQQIIELEKRKIKYDCSGAVGNSVQNYPCRISGFSNGCIGEEGHCEKIPSDWDLHAAILNLKKDFNNDSIIDIEDLGPAINLSEDLNQDGTIDIYDINYPQKIKYTIAIKNPSLIRDDELTSYNLTGKISNDGEKIILDSPIDIIYPDMVEGNEKYSKEKRMELYLVVNPEIVIYRNKIVTLKGKITSGITQSYQDGFLFRVEDILGVVK